MHSLTSDDYDKRLVAVRRIALCGGISVYLALPGEKQAMEMTEYGKP
jgi:hypothetical protein